MRLTKRALNRTLLARQHLLARTHATVPAMVDHLVGLQAQAPMPPYLGLAARVTSFDPYDVTRGLEDRSLVRLLTMRGPAIVAALSEGPLVVLSRTASVVLKLFFDQGVVLRGTTVE